MDKDQYIKLRKKEALDLAKAIIDGATDPIVGFRKLASIQSDFKHIKEFERFIGLESETDDFPRGDVRKEFNKTYLEELDREADVYLAESGEVIKEACDELIKALS